MHASGCLLYHRAEEIINKVATIKSRQKNISYYSSEDLEQEIKIKCFAALSKHGQRAGENLFNFFGCIADNALRDINRKLIYNPVNSQKHSNRKLALSIVIPLPGYPSIDSHPESIVLRDYFNTHLSSGIVGLYNKFQNHNFDVKSLSKKERDLLFVEVSGLMENW